MIEVIVVISVGAILLSMALRGFGEASSRMAVENARRNFSALQARARAYAIERGETTELNVDPAEDVAWVEASAGRIEVVDYDETRNVDVQSETSGVIRLCLSPRGFAETTCNSFGSGTVSLSFVQGAQVAELTILPLGQIEW